MSERQRLPNKRKSRTITFDHDGLSYTACFSFSKTTGEPLEVFLDCGKTGSAANILAKEIAVIASISLQYGVPLEVLMAAMPRLDDESAAGPFGKALGLALE